MPPQMSSASASSPGAAAAPVRVAPVPEIVRPAPRRPRKTGRWLILGVIVIAAGGAAYWQSRRAAESRKTQVVVTRTAAVGFGDLHQTIRISGVIVAEKSMAIMAPQLRGSYNGRGRQAGNASISVRIPDTPATLMGTAAGSSTGGPDTTGTTTSNTGSGTTPGGTDSSSSTNTSTSTANSSNSNSSNPSSAAVSNSNTSSLGAKRGTTNRFSSAATQSNRNTSNRTNNTNDSAVTDPSTSPDLGSTGSQLGQGRGPGQGGTGGGGGRGGGGGGGGANNDFMLVLLNVASPGAHVKKGEVVAEFDRQYQMLRLDDYRASLTQLEANIKKLRANIEVAREAYRQLAKVAKADLDKAQLDLKTIEVRSAIEAEKYKLAVDEAQARYKQLLSEQKLSDTSYQAQLRAAEVDRDQAKIELQRAQVNVDRMVIKAPMNGIVVMQTIFRGGDFGQVQQGDQIYPGMMFMTIVDPSSMIVNASVNQSDSELLRLGQKATARFDAYPDLALRATVVGLGAMTKPGMWRPNYLREIPVRLKLNEMDARVIPDLSASAEVVLATENQAPVAPLGAIFRDTPDGRPYVFLQGPAGFTRKEVELGPANNIAVAVRSGLQKGDLVAVERP